MYGAGNWSNNPGARAMQAGSTATNQGMNAQASGNTNLAGGFNWGNHGGDMFRRDGGERPMGFGHGFGALGGGMGGFNHQWGPIRQGLQSAFQQWHQANPGMGGFRQFFQQMQQPPAGAPPGLGGVPPQPTVPGGMGAGVPPSQPPMGQPQGPPAWGQGGDIQGLLSKLFPGGFPGQGQGPMA